MKKNNYTPFKNVNSVETHYPQNSFLDLFQSIAYQNAQNSELAKIQQQQEGNNKSLLPSLKRDESQIWKRKMFEIQTKQQKYFNQFKSISFQGGMSQPTQEEIEVERYKNVIKQSKKCVIQDIVNDNQQIPKYTSNLDFPQYTINNYIRSPALYSLNFSNEFQKENCYKITQQLRYENRDIFKHRETTQKKNSSNSQQILDLKQLNNEVYKQVIIQKYSNQIFNSIIKNYGSISLDQYVELPEKYEIKQKKDFQSIEINTDEVETQRFSAFNTIKRIDLLKLEIERQKKRKVKAKDYFKVMQNKLIQYLDYVIKDQPQILLLEVSEKIKYILKDLNKYKGKEIEGELKTTLLLYFFREFKLLKDEKEEYEKKIKMEEESKKKKKVANIALKQAPQFQFKILPTAEKKPNILTSVKKTPPPRVPKQEDSWIGILKQ